MCVKLVTYQKLYRDARSAKYKKKKKWDRFKKFGSSAEKSEFYELES